MKHPFQGIGLLYYSISWAIIIMAHVVVLYFGYDLALTTSITDALLCNLLLSFLGFGLWWAIQYIKPDTQGTLSAISSYIVLVILSVILTDFICRKVLGSIFSDDADYLWILAGATPWRLITSSLYLGIIILVYYLIKSSGVLIEKEKEEAQLQSLLKHSELEVLKFQINPHFIFNSLNSISSLTLAAPEKAREMVIKLSDFLRGSLGQSQSDMQNLEKELEQMNLYLDIEKVRFGDRLKVTKEIDKESNAAMVPNMILQPLFENAIKYGIYEQLEDVKIKVKTAITDNNLSISIENNYDSQSTPQKGKGIGLKNVRSRLELIYGVSDLVTIEKSKDLFCVKMVIPQNLKND